MSRIYVPPSQDTLFMRGFSFHHKVEDIRDFFLREAGRCMLEFNKDDGSDGQYVALKFESRDVAKDVYRRFNDREIMGNRISMTWYKDLRKIKRMSGPQRRFQRGGYYGGDQYDFRGSYQRPSYQRSQYQRTSAGHVRKYSRSSSRSRSPTRSPTRSRSRSRSSSRSYGSKDLKKSRSSGFNHRVKDRKKRTKHIKNEAYESPVGKNADQVKNDSSWLDGSELMDSRNEDKFGANDSMVTENRDGNDTFETSPQHKMAAVRSLVQKKTEDGDNVISGDKQQSTEKEPTNPDKQSDDHQKESSDNEKNILELHPSDDEELEIEDNIDDTSLLSLNFSNPVPEAASNKNVAEVQNSEPIQNDKDEPSNLAYKDPAENEPARDVYRHATNKPMVSFDLHVQHKKDTIAGLSFEKLNLMNEKKMEIEKAYRQDCETLVMVTKLLVSKDSELEDRIQNSLRENLREIGQRCIQELKEFVEKIRSDEQI